MAIDKILKELKTNPALTGALSGAASGALVSAFTKKKGAKKLLKGAGLLAVGGVAWKAWQSYQEGQKGAPAQVEKQVGPAQIEHVSQQSFEAVVDAAPDHQASTALVMQAMIAAAHADGHLSAGEQKLIWQQAVEAKLPAADLATLQDQLATPMPVPYFAAAAEDLETRIDVYTASLLVIDETCAEGAAHLQDLAAQLELPPPLVAALHERQSG